MRSATGEGEAMNTQALPRFGPGRRARRARSATTSVVARLRAHLTVPQNRNGYALVASSTLTSVLGLGFWIVAARLYSPAAVGLSAALISAMALLANTSHLNLSGALNKFLPRAGSTTGRFVISGYLLALGLSGLTSLIFIAGLGVWTPRLGFLGDRPELVLCFVAATMAWTIFVLQDSVLAGIRQAVWVPAENLVFSISKIALLFVVAASFPTLGVFVSWALPAMVLIVPVTLLLFRRLIPAHVRETRDREQPVGVRRVARYAAPDYLAYVIWVATISVLPLIVLDQRGPPANAYYYVSWSVAYSLYLVSSSMGMALLAEASLDPARLGEHRRRMIIESARLVVPAAVMIVVAAPVILGLMGKAYSDESITLLRLLAISAVPFIFVTAHVNSARAEQRMRVVVCTWAALCGLVFAFGLPLLGSLGVTGLGVAWLAAQSTVAAGITVGHLRRGSWEERRRRALRTASAAWRRTRRWRRPLGSARDADAILQMPLRDLPGASAWVVQGHLEALNDVAVSVIGPRGGAPAALLKRACTPAADGSLQNQEQALLALHGDLRLVGEWTRILPEVLASGEFAGRRFLVETAVEGVSADRLLEQDADLEMVAAAITAAIEPLHEATREVTVVDEHLLREWIDVPLSRLRPVVASRSRLAGAEGALERLGRELRKAFAGRRVATSWIHGDLCPGNVLMSPDGAKVRGIVDWERGTRGPPELDFLHLLITTRMSVERREMGAVIAELLENQDGEHLEHMALLAWLHHVSGNLAKCARYARSRVWVRRNVDPVLRTAQFPPPQGERVA
jgi:O-antigen/teichoic acid export membrane protein/aminoglycoside phosphotransferase (APT) family kinase protein